MKYNKKLCMDDKTGGHKLRVWYSKAKKLSKISTRPPSYTIKCGCCDEKITISDFGDSLEIGGVFASKEEWSKLLTTLLKKKKEK